MNRRGFSLIELMVVIAIIGTLLAIAVPRFTETLKKSAIEGEVRELSLDLMQARATALTQRAATSVILTPVSYSGPGVSRTFKYPVTWQGKAAGDSQIKIDFDERGSYDVTNNTNLAICVAPSVPDARVDSVVVFSLGNHLGKLTLGGTCDSGHITVQ